MFLFLVSNFLCGNSAKSRATISWAEILGTLSVIIPALFIKTGFVPLISKLTQETSYTHALPPPRKIDTCNYFNASAFASFTDFFQNIPAA